MDQSIDPPLIAEIEQALGQVADIRAARVVSSDDGVIQEIHVLASPTKSPKQLVRDIESTIMAQFGIPIDHRTVSIAQLGRDSEPRDPREKGRARITSVICRRGYQRTWGAHQYHGAEETLGSCAR